MLKTILIKTLIINAVTAATGFTIISFLINFRSGAALVAGIIISCFSIYLLTQQFSAMASKQNKNYVLHLMLTLFLRFPVVILLLFVSLATLKLPPLILGIGLSLPVIVYIITLYLQSTKKQ